MTVSLIVPNKNNEPVLDLFLERLRDNTPGPEFELIVVDDGSSDRSREILRRWRDAGAFERFTLIERESSGIIATLNAALAEASGEIVVRLDGDATIETPGWLERMLSFYGSDERIGVVVGKIVFDSGHVHSYGMNIVVPEGVHDRGTLLTEPVGERTLHAADMLRRDIRVAQDVEGRALIAIRVNGYPRFAGGGGRRLK